MMQYIYCFRHSSLAKITGCRSEKESPQHYSLETRGRHGHEKVSIECFWNRAVGKMEKSFWYKEYVWTFYSLAFNLQSICSWLLCYRRLGCCERRNQLVHKQANVNTFVLVNSAIRNRWTNTGIVDFQPLSPTSQNWTGTGCWFAVHCC